MQLKDYPQVIARLQRQILDLDQNLIGKASERKDFRGGDRQSHRLRFNPQE